MTEADCRGRRPLHPARTRSCPATCSPIPAGTCRRAGVRPPLRRRPAPPGAGRGRRRLASPASLTRSGRAARHALHAGPRRRTAGCGSPRRSASTATSPAGPRRCSTPASTCSCVDTAHGHQEQMLEAVRAVRALDPAVPDRRRQRRHRRGHPRPRRGRRRHRQGRRRPGRDVHDADDDRRRPAAVLRRARVRRRRRARSASTSGPTAACATRATSRWRSRPARPT